MFCLPLTSDLVFHAVFGQASEESDIALKGFLKDVLGLDAVAIKHTNLFDLDKMSVNKSHVVKFNATLSDLSRFNIQIHMSNSDNMNEHMICLGSLVKSAQTTEKDGVFQSQGCIVINIVTNQTGELDTAVQRYVFKERSTNDVLSDSLELVTINTGVITEDADTTNMPAVYSWLRLIQLSEEIHMDELECVYLENHGLCTALKLLNALSSNVDLRAGVRYREYFFNQKMHHIQVDGFILGYQDAYINSYADGVASGEVKALKDVIKRAPMICTDNELVALTGMPFDVVQSIRYNKRDIILAEHKNEPEEVTLIDEDMLDSEDIEVLNMLEGIYRGSKR